LSQGYVSLPVNGLATRHPKSSLHEAACDKYHRYFLGKTIER
jgi:hypothetical protein